MAAPDSTMDAVTTGDRLLTESEVAEILGVSIRTTQRWRWAGGGPRFAKLGGRVRYRRGDVEVFIADHLCSPGGDE